MAEPSQALKQDNKFNGLNLAVTTAYTYAFAYPRPITDGANFDPVRPGAIKDQLRALGLLLAKLDAILERPFCDNDADSRSIHDPAIRRVEDGDVKGRLWRQRA